MKNLTDLPIELILEIFNYLEYDDLIVLKKLNEKWTDLVIRCIESKIVVISESRSSYRSSYLDNSYLVGKSLITFRKNTDLHIWIKKLVLNGQVFLFNLIDNFDNLIDLEIYLDKELKSKHPGQLFLRIKNLKYLTFFRSYNSNLKICLDTPKLIDLDIGSSYLDHFEIIYPFSIKYLRTFCSNKVINQMGNLEELTLFHFNISSIGNLFNEIEGLKKISFYYAEDGFNSTNQFLQTTLLSNPTLKINFRGIDLNSDLNLSRIDLNLNRHGLYYYLNDQDVRIYMNYLDNISNLEHFNLEIQNLDQISTEFIQKLTNLEILKINRITDQEKWIQLLSLPELTKIEIRSFVDQEYLNLIPKYCKFLNSLNIKQVKNDELLLELKYLNDLKTNYLVDFEIFQKLVNNLKHLETIQMKDVYKVEIKHGSVECSYNKEIIEKYSKSLFFKTIESCTSWTDLFWNLEFK